MQTSAERDTRDLARGAGVNYLGFAARLGARAPFLFLAGLLYGEASFGIYTFSVTLVETAAGLALFGLKRSLFKFMSEELEQEGSALRATANGIALALAGGAAVTIAVAWGAGFLAALFRLPSASGPLLLLSPAILLIVTSDILLVAIRFTRQMRFEVYARSIAEPVTLTLAVVVVYYTPARQYGLVIGYLASLLVAAGASAVFFARLYPLGRCLRVSLHRAEVRRLIHFSGPTAGYDLLVSLADKVDIFLVTYYSPAAVVGIYGMARQFSTFTKKVRQGFDRILPPVVAQGVVAGDMERVRDQIATVTRWILTVQILIILVFSFYADDLLGLMGGGFAAGALILLLLVSGDAVNGAFGVSELPIVYLRPAVNLVIGAALLLLNLGLNFWLIAELGAVGAALAVLSTYVVINALRIEAARRMLGRLTVKLDVLKPVAAAALPFGITFQLDRLAAPGLATALGLPVLIGGYLGALVLLGIDAEDRRQLQRLFRRSRA